MPNKASEVVLAEMSPRTDEQHLNEIAKLIKNENDLKDYFEQYTLIIVIDGIQFNYRSSQLSMYCKLLSQCGAVNGHQISIDIDKIDCEQLTDVALVKLLVNFIAYNSAEKTCKLVDKIQVAQRYDVLLQDNDGIPLQRALTKEGFKSVVDKLLKIASWTQLNDKGVKQVLEQLRKKAGNNLVVSELLAKQEADFVDWIVRDGKDAEKFELIISVLENLKKADGNRQSPEFKAAEKCLKESSEITGSYWVKFDDPVIKGILRSLTHEATPNESEEKNDKNANPNKLYLAVEKYYSRQKEKFDQEKQKLEEWRRTQVSVRGGFHRGTLVAPVSLPSAVPPTPAAAAEPATLAGLAATGRTFSLRFKLF